MKAGLSILAALLAAHSAAAGSVLRRTPADVRGEVEIVNVAGEVHVIGWERAEVQVQAELGRGVERLDLTREGGHTTVKVVLPRHGGSSATSVLTVHVPRDSSVSINTVSADQTVEQVHGAQRLQSVSGSIEAALSKAEFEAKSVSGDVAIRGDDTSGPVRVTTVSGDITARDVGRELELGTVTGDMLVNAAELSRVRIKTTNGDLDLTAKLARDARIEAEAINGDLHFHWREPVQAEFDIETFNGDIYNCFGPEPKRTREFAPGNELRFAHGGGNARVRVKTLNGTVEVCTD